MNRVMTAAGSMVSPTAIWNRDNTVFAAMAGLFAVAAAVVGQATGPFEADPDYAYLLNGLSIITLHHPKMVFHPGTPVQLIIAAVSAIVWMLRLPFVGYVSIERDVLSHPVIYLNAANMLFMACDAAGLFFLAMQLRSYSGSLATALAGAGSVFINSPAFLAIHRVTPEPVLLAASLVVAGLIVPAAFASEAFAANRRFFLALGSALGFSVATKVSALPLMATIAFLRSGRAKLHAAAAVAISFALLTVPIWRNYDVMLRFFFGYYTHVGPYGSGPAGFPDWRTLVGNTGYLFTQSPETFLSAGLWWAVLLTSDFRNDARNRNLVRLLLLCLAVIVLALVLVAKQPNPRYLICTVGFICAGNAASAHILLRQTVRAPVFMFLLSLLAIAAVWRDEAAVSDRYLARLDDEATLTRASSSGCHLVVYYETTRPEFELYFGAVWAGQQNFSRTLTQLYPGFIAYDPES